VDGEESPALLAAIQYMTLLDAVDPHGMANLFAPDGLLQPPPKYGGGVYRGRHEILAFYIANPPVSHTRINASYVADGRRCAVNIVATPPGGPTFDVVDMITVDDDGLIANCVVYER